MMSENAKVRSGQSSRFMLIENSTVSELTSLAVAAGAHPAQPMTAILVSPDLVRVIGELLRSGVIPKPGRAEHGDRDGVVLMTESDLVRLTHLEQKGADAGGQQPGAFSKRVDGLLARYDLVLTDGPADKTLAEARNRFTVRMAQVGFKPGEQVVLVPRVELDALEAGRRKGPRRVVYAQVDRHKILSVFRPNNETLVLCPDPKGHPHKCGDECALALDEALFGLFPEGKAVAIVPAEYLAETGAG
jgi:hypothetical protein